MQAAFKTRVLTPEEYLSHEARSEVRHEYLGGMLYAMAGASEEHNIISLNLAAALRSHLRDKPCRVFMADMKVRVHIATEHVFYYPDVMVAGDARDTDRYSKRYPKVLIEVLSQETERTDRREKFLSYSGIETLEEYVLVAQDKVEVTIFRRTNQWQPEMVTETLQLPSLEFLLPLSSIYDGVKL
jgi:Uma2 family endonuclease